MRHFLIVLLAALGVCAPAQAACTAKSQAARSVALKVQGQKSTGYASLPATKPKALVVVAHGYSWTAAAWKSKLKAIAGADRAVAVAPNIRGLKLLPQGHSRGIPLRNAKADLIAYGKKYAASCPTIKTVVLVGYSLGGPYATNALMSHPKRAGGKPLFDYFVGMEAMEDVFAEFQLAKQLPNDAFVQGAVQDAKDELGGTIDEKPEAYHAINPIEHIAQIRASKIRGVFLVHGVDDGLVPYSQATDMAKALRDGGVKTDLLTARKRRPGDEPDTTLSGRFGQPSGDSGHASDTAIHHLVPSTGLKVLHDLIVSGRKPANRTLDAG
jgi:hypothetical protein